MFDINGLIDSQSENQYILSRTIQLSGDIEEMNVKDVVDKILMLVKLSNKPITLLLDTYGGDVYGALYLTDFISSVPCEITSIVVGKAMSAGFVIAVGGQEGRRYMMPNATMMNHEISAEAIGKMSEMEGEIQECKRLEVLMDHIIKTRTRCPQKVVQAMKKRDTYFTARQCLRYKFVDKVISKLVIPQLTRIPELY